jgi:hypothetical protein
MFLDFCQKSKASVLLSCLLLVDGTVAPDHPFQESWSFWWQKSWWADIAKRVKNIPSAEVHMDIPAWLRTELTLAARSVENLFGGAGEVQEKVSVTLCNNEVSF